MVIGGKAARIHLGKRGIFQMIQSFGKAKKIHLLEVKAVKPSAGTSDNEKVKVPNVFHPMKIGQVDGLMTFLNRSTLTRNVNLAEI